MKLKTIMLIFFMYQCIQCHPNKSKRSVSYYDYLTNKTHGVVTYVKNKARSLWSFQRIPESVENKAVKMKQKLKYYIEEAQKTASTIYDKIAPEVNEFECKDDDPAVHMTTPQLIILHGYFAESHVVVTEDGYMLTVHRIPYSRKSTNKKVPKNTVLIHHGLLGSSADWVLFGPRESLAFILSDAGYDVWMANVRGNSYSRAHICRSVDSSAFWNFSFHEVAQYDLPAVIDYITEMKDVKINYIGFSMGTTVLFTLLSTKTEYNEKLNAGFALAPIAFMSDIKSPFKILSKFGNTLERFLKLVGANEFLPRNAAIRYMSKHSCDIAQLEEALCEMSMYVMCGNDNEHFDRAMLPMVLGHAPAGASTRTLAHYAQEINNNGRFQQFDYGAEANLKLYGAQFPPEYAVKNISLSISLLSAEDDWLSSLTDARILLKELKNPVEHFIIEDKKFNHLDFVFAKDARSLVYEKLLKMLKNAKF